MVYNTTAELRDKERRSKLLPKRVKLISVVVGGLLLLVCFAIIYVARQVVVENEKFKRESDDNKVILTQIIEEVSLIRTKLGRAPSDEKELKALLGREMPKIHIKDVEVPINYFRKSDSEFYLVFFDGNVRRYDSEMPESGWSIDRSD